MPSPGSVEGGGRASSALLLSCPVLPPPYHHDPKGHGEAASTPLGWDPAPYACGGEDPKSSQCVSSSAARPVSPPQKKINGVHRALMEQPLLSCCLAERWQRGVGKKAPPSPAAPSVGAQHPRGAAQPPATPGLQVTGFFFGGGSLVCWEGARKGGPDPSAMDEGLAGWMGGDTE